MPLSICDVRFTLENRHPADGKSCRLKADIGACQCDVRFFSNSGHSFESSTLLRELSQERLPEGQRKNVQNRPMRHYRSAETTPRRSQPRKSPPLRGLCTCVRDYGDRENCVVADAVQREPVSTAKFPANREKNREFLNFRPVRGFEDHISLMITLLLTQIPYARKQGIFAKEQGI
jgi:hypothetical protein